MHAGSSFFNQTAYSARNKPNESLGLEKKYEFLIKSCSQSTQRSDTFRELTKTHYGSDYWRNWNAARPELAVKIHKLQDYQNDLKNKERNFQQHNEENQGRNFDEDYFVTEVKSEIENLDRWYYNNKHFMDVNMFKEKDDINGAQTLQRQDKNERLQIPDLDIRMLDLILQEGNEISDVRELDLDLNKKGGNGIRSSKGSEQMKHEHNKQLLLELIVKKLKQDSRNFYSKTHLHSSIKLLIQDTMSRFKTMKSLYGNASFLNDYDRLYEMVTGREMEGPRAAEKELAILKKGNRLDYKRYEGLVKSRYLECIEEINTRKKAIEDIRRLNYSKQVAMEEQQRRFAEEIERNKREEEEIHEMNKRQPNKRNIRAQNKEALTLNDFMKITKIEHLISDLKKKAQEEALMISDDIDRGLAEIKRIENEVVDLKMKRVIYKYRLKEIYVSVLKKPKLILKFGKRLSEFVNLFHFINEEMQEAYLPDFIDHETYQYIVKMASFEARIDELKRVEDDPEVEEKTAAFKQTSSLFIPLSTNREEYAPPEDDYLLRERNEISNLLRSTSFGFAPIKRKNNDEILKRYEEKIKEIKKSTLKIYQLKKIPQGKGKPPIIRREEVINHTQTPTILDPRKYAANESNMSRIGKKKKAGEELIQIGDQVEILKKKQVAKMYRNFDAKPLSERSVKECKILLALLFGKRFAELTLERFLRDKQLSSNKRGESMLNSKLVNNLTSKISSLNMNSMRSKLSKQNHKQPGDIGVEDDDDFFSSSSEENT